MPPVTIDLRSDTVTRPTAGMRNAIATAEVGDDVFRDDPTVIELERRVADMLGKEAALFVSSGTMGNLLAVRTHCQPGDEIICEADCHIYNYEQGGAAQLCGVTVRPVEGRGGMLYREQLDGLIRPDNEHLVRTRLLALENTHNRGGGRILPYDEVETVCSWAREQGLRTHLDGARLMNAVVASGIAADRWAEHFDTVSLCFSKGLGAPVGSALCGPSDFIERARRHRKVLGGGMRQVGILAAGALYALEHLVDRLADDHAGAQQLADVIRRCAGLELRPAEVDTNLVIFCVEPKLGSAGELVQRLSERGVQMIAFGATLIRACFHLDVSPQDVQQACRVMEEVVAQMAAGEGRPQELRVEAY